MPSPRCQHSRRSLRRAALAIAAAAIVVLCPHQAAAVGTTLQAIATSSGLQKWFPDTIVDIANIGLPTLQFQYYLFTRTTNPYQPGVTANMTYHQAVSACQSIGGDVISSLDPAIWPTSTPAMAGTFPGGTEDSMGNARIWVGFRRHNYNLPNETASLIDGSFVNISSADLNALYVTAPSAGTMRNDGQCYALADTTDSVTHDARRLVAVDCFINGSNHQALALCQRPFAGPSMPSWRWFRSVGGAFSNSVEAAILTISAKNVTLDREACHEAGGDLGIVQTASLAQEVILPAVQALFPLSMGSVFLGFDCACVGSVFVQSVSYAVPGVPATLCAGSCSTPGTFYALGVSAGTNIGRQTIAYAISNMVVCTNLLANISATFVTSSVAAGSTAILRISTTHTNNHRDITVLVALDHNVLVSGTRVVFPKGSANTDSEISIFIPQTATFDNITATVAILGPGIGVNRDVRWTTSNTITVKRQLYTLSLSPSTFSMRTGEVVSVTATLNLPYADDVVFAPYPNSAVELPMITFPSGATSITISVKATAPTAGAMQVFYGCAQLTHSQTTDRNHKPMLTVTIAAPFTFSWTTPRSDGFILYDNRTMDFLPVTLNLLGGSPTSPISFQMTTNCSTLLSFSPTTFTIPAASITASIGIYAGRIFYDRIACSVSAVITSSFKGAEAPPSTVVTIRRQIRVAIARAPAAVTTADSAVAQFTIPYYWGTGCVRMRPFLTACDSFLQWTPTSFDFTSDPATWTANFTLSVTGARPSSYTECTWELRILSTGPCSDQKSFRHTSRQTKTFSIIARDNANLPVHVNQIESDPGDAHTLTGYQFRVWLDQAFTFAGSRSICIKQDDGASNFVDLVVFASTDFTLVPADSYKYATFVLQYPRVGANVIRACYCVTSTSSCSGGHLPLDWTLDITPRALVDFQFRLADGTVTSTLPSAVDSSVPVIVEYFLTSEIPPNSSYVSMNLTLSNPGLTTTFAYLYGDLPKPFETSSFTLTSADRFVSVRQNPLSWETGYERQHSFIDRQLVRVLSKFSWFGNPIPKPFNDTFTVSVSYFVGTGETVVANISIIPAHDTDRITFSPADVTFSTGTSLHTITVTVWSLTTGGSSAFTVRATAFSENGAPAVSKRIGDKTLTPTRSNRFYVVTPISGVAPGSNFVVEPTVSATFTFEVVGEPLSVSLTNFISMEESYQSSTLTVSGSPAFLGPVNVTFTLPGGQPLGVYNSIFSLGFRASFSITQPMAISGQRFAPACAIIPASRSPIPFGGVLAPRPLSSVFVYHTPGTTVTATPLPKSIGDSIYTFEGMPMLTFGDNTAVDVTLGDPATMTPATQYFPLNFTGNNNTIASCELPPTGFKMISAYSVGPMIVNTDILAGSRGRQTIMVVIALPPWHDPNLLTGTPLTLTPSLVGFNTSFFTLTPTSVTLTVSRVTRQYSFPFTLEGTVNEHARAWLHVNVTPASPFFTGHIHPVPVRLSPLRPFYLEYDPETKLYGCYDYIMANATLSPAALTPMELEMLIENEYHLVIGPRVLTTGFTTGLNITLINSTTCPQPLANDSVTAPYSFQTNGTESYKYLVPNPVAILLAPRIGFHLVDPPEELYQGVENAINVTVVLERLPKAGRTLTIAFTCSKYNASHPGLWMPEVRSQCAVVPKNISFTSSSPSTSVNVLWYATVPNEFFRVTPRIVDFKAPEFIPMNATLQVAKTCLEKHVTFVKWLTQLTWLPAGKSTWFNVTSEKTTDGCSVGGWSVLSVILSPNITVAQGSLVPGSYVNLPNNCTNSSTVTVTAASNIAEDTVMRIGLSVSSYNPAFAVETTPPYLELGLMPQHTVPVDVNNANFYLGTTLKNVMTINWPQHRNNISGANTSCWVRLTTTGSVSLNVTVGLWFPITPGPYDIGIISTTQPAGSTFDICWQRSSDSAISYCFEYKDIYASTVQCRRFTVFNQAEIRMSVDPVWYVGDTLVVTAQVPTADLLRCTNDTVTVVTTQNPPLDFSVTRDSSSAFSVATVNITAIAPLTLAGSFDLNATASGTCFNFLRTWMSVPYQVVGPTSPIVSNFPTVAFLGERIPIVINISVLAYHDSNNDTTITIRWTGGSTTAILSLAMHPDAFMTFSGGAYTLRMARQNFYSLSMSIAAEYAQPTPAMFNFTVNGIRKRYIGPLQYLAPANASGYFIIPPLQAIQLTSNKPAVESTITGAHNEIEILFFSETFCMTATRTSQTYSVSLSVSPSVNTSVMTLVSSTGSLNALLFRRWCYAVLSEESPAAPLNFYVAQSRNLYIPITNTTINVRAPGIVSIVGGAFNAMICGPENGRNMTLTPSRATLRDDVSVNVTLNVDNGAYVVTYSFPPWPRGSGGNRSLFIFIPCNVMVNDTSSVVLTQTYSSLEYVPVVPERSFPFTLRPKSMIVVSGLRAKLFRRQTMILEIHPASPPVQWPLTLTVSLNVNGDLQGYVDAESLAGSLTWPVNDASTKTVELFGTRPTLAVYPLVLNVSDNPEFDGGVVKCLNQAALTNCSLEVVDTSTFDRGTQASVIVFVGTPQTFNLTQQTCHRGVRVDARLSPFEFSNAMTLSPNNITFVCDPSNPILTTVTVTGREPPGSDATSDPTPYPTQLLIQTSEELSGATTFSQVGTPNPGLSIEIRRPARITAVSSSGAYLFFGRVTNITVYVPRLPSLGFIDVTATTTDAAVILVGAPTWSAVGGGSLAQVVQVSLDGTAVGSTEIILFLSGLAQSEFYFGSSFGTTNVTLRMEKLAPFTIHGDLVVRRTQFVENISYALNITLQSPVQSASETVAVTVMLKPLLANGLNGPTAFTSASAYFGVGRKWALINISGPYPGTFNLSSTVVGSISYEDDVTFAIPSITFTGRLTLAHGNISTEQYVSRANQESVEIRFPQMFSGYWVGFREMWDSTFCTQHCVISVDGPRTVAATTVMVPSSVTKLFYSCSAPARCTLLLAVNGSAEFSKDTLRIGTITFLPLISIIRPPVTEYSILVRTTVTVVVNVSSPPPVGTMFRVMLADTRDGITVSPSVVTLVSDGPTTASFDITPTIVTDAQYPLLVPFRVDPNGTKATSFDTASRLNIRINSRALLSPLFRLGSTDIRALATRDALNTSTPIEIYVGPSNAITINMTLPSFYLYTAPSSLSVQPTSENLTVLTAALASVPQSIETIGTQSTTQDGIIIASGVILKPANIFPVSLNLLLVGINTAAVDVTGVVAITITSSTGEYQPVSYIPVRVRPLFTIVIAMPFDEVVAGDLNTREFTIGFSGFPTTGAGQQAVAVTILVTSSCGALVPNPSMLTFVTNTRQTVRLRGTDAARCDLRIQQPSGSAQKLFTSEAIIKPITVVAQPEVVLLLVVDDVEVSSVSAEHMRTRGVTFRLTSSSVGWSAGLSVTPLNDTSVTGITVGSAFKRSVFLSPSPINGEMYTGFWRAITTALGIPISSSDGEPRKSFAEMWATTATNMNTSIIRWSINNQHKAIDISISALPDYTTDRDEDVVIVVRNTSFLNNTNPKATHASVRFTIVADKVIASYSREKSATSTILFVASAVAGPLSYHAATEAGKLLVFLSMARCPDSSWISSQPHMDLFMLPLRPVLPFLANIASEEDLGAYAGTIVGSIIFVGVWAGVHCLFTLLLFKIRFPDADEWRETQGYLSFPSLTWFPLLLVYVPTMVAIIRLILYSPLPTLKLLASLTLILFIIIVPLAAFLLSYKARVLTYYPPQRNAIFQWLFAQGMYRHEDDPDWMGRFGGMIKPLRGEVRWFFVLEIFALAALSVVIGINPATERQCLLRNIFICVFFFVMFMVFIIMQPMSRKIDNFFFALISLLEAIVASLMTTQTGVPSNAPLQSIFLDPSKSTDSAVSALVTVIAALIIVRAAIVWVFTIWRWARNCSQLHKDHIERSVTATSKRSLARTARIQKLKRLRRLQQSADGASAAAADVSDDDKAMQLVRSSSSSNESNDHDGNDPTDRKKKKKKSKKTQLEARLFGADKARNDLLFGEDSASEDEELRTLANRVRNREDVTMTRADAEFAEQMSREALSTVIEGDRPQRFHMFQRAFEQGAIAMDPGSREAAALNPKPRGAARGDAGSPHPAYSDARSQSPYREGSGARAYSPAVPRAEMEFAGDEDDFPVTLAATQDNDGWGDDVMQWFSEAQAGNRASH